MKASNRIQISAPFERLFDTAADIGHWPDFLPHYRWVKILARGQGRVTAEMAARHRGIPLWWRTLQRPLPLEKRIEFTHIGGITRGMEVQWTFEEAGASCLGPTWLVQIHHRFDPSWPSALGPWFADRIIGKLFVGEVANKTLTRMKALLEGSAPSELSPRNAERGVLHSET